MLLPNGGSDVTLAVNPYWAYWLLLKASNGARVGAEAVTVAGTSWARKYSGSEVIPASNALMRLRRNCTGSEIPRVPRYRTSMPALRYTSCCTPRDQVRILGMTVSSM